MLPANVSAVDRVIRLVMGVLLLGLYGALESPWKYFTLLGLYLVATALSRFCPLYHLIGLSTRRT